MAFKIPVGEKKSKYVQTSFTRIAAKYDLFNDLVTQGMHRYWKNQLVKKANLQTGDVAVDLCCGTGDIAQRLKVAVGKAGKVIGLDFSPGMLHVASTRRGDSFLLNGNAMKLPLQDNSVDAVTVGYGLRNLVDIQPCLDEVLRVLKPGGRFMILEMGKVKVPIIKDLFRFYFFRVVPIIGKLLYRGEDMFDYFPQSTVEYPSQEEMVQRLSGTGFQKVSFSGFYCGSVVIHYAEK